MFYLLVIKSIGILPVALAMGSFLFLIFLLSYHTLQKSFREVEQCREAYLETSRNKYQIANQIVNVLREKGDDSFSYDKMLSLGSTLMSTQVNIEENMRANVGVQKEIDLLQAIITNTPQLKQDSQIQELVNQLVTKDTSYLIAYKKYAYNLKYYNNFVAKMPSKLVAQIAGFKKFA
ncbi:MAG: LemA family protein [Raineya sp.]|jgi:hypothetical protein|nr:LemA family protein [Raineya sp.]